LAYIRSAVTMIVSRAPHLTVLALVRTAKLGPGHFFRSAENSSEAIAGNLTPIVHTAAHSIRRLDSCPKETA